MLDLRFDGKSGAFIGAEVSALLLFNESILYQRVAAQFCGIY